MNPKMFANPANEFRGVTLWMLNDKLEADEIRRQLIEIHDKGIGAVIARTFMGLRTDYLSEEWMEIMGLIVKQAGELGMEVFFQAGYMPSGIPDQKEEFAHVALSSLARDEELQEGQTAVAEDETAVYVQSTRIHVLDMFNTDAVTDYLKGAYEETWFAHFGDQFGKTISSVWVDEPHFSPPHLPWGNILKQQFLAEWGYRIEEHIPSLFVERNDYAKIRHHYWRTVTRLLLDGYFDQVSQWCEKHNVSFSGHLMGEDTLAAQIAFTGACMPLYEKMQLPGIDHLTMSLNWSHWSRSREGDEWRFVMTPKQCSSAANQFGRERILAEIYAVSSEGITLEDRKQIADWFFVMGINYRCLHGSFYSMRGRRKRFYVPHLSYQQPWWQDNHLISDYCNRVSYALHQGRFCADIMLLHPVESAYCRFSSPRGKMGDPSSIAGELNEMNDSFAGLSERLMKIHRSFEYGDEKILSERGTVAEGEIKCGLMRYKTVVLPDLITLRKSTVELLTSFIDQGGVVLATGNLPTRIDGEETENIAALTSCFTRVANEETALAEALNSACPPRISVTPKLGNASNVFLHERSLGDNRVMVFLTNTSRTEQTTISLDLRGTASVVEWDAAKGTQHALPAKTNSDLTSTELSFAPLQSHLLLFDLSSVSDTARAPEMKTEVIAEIGSWSLKRKTPNAITLDYCRLKKGDGDFSSILPVIAIQQILQHDDPYSGPIAMQFEFEIEKLPDALAVAIEDADHYGITINGHSVSYAGMPSFMDQSFMPVDLTPHLLIGRNTLEISVDFSPLEEPKFGLSRLFANVSGTEIESIYLIGDFGIKAGLSAKEQRDESVRYAPEFTITSEADRTDGDLIASGCPFFAGEVELSAEFQVNKEATDNLSVALPDLHSCTTEVIINGQSAGWLTWQPHHVDISDFVQEGANTLVLRLKNTLRNLLGPHHRPLVERQQNWGYNDYAGNYSEVTGQGYPDWYNNRSEDTDAWTEDYYFVRFGLYMPAEIRAAIPLSQY